MAVKGINRIKTLSLLALLFIAVPVGAVNRFYNNGSGDNTWENPTNWGGVLPGSGDQAFVQSGLTANLTTWQIIQRVRSRNAGTILNINSGGFLDSRSSVSTAEAGGTINVNDGGIWRHTGSALDHRTTGGTTVVNDGGELFAAHYRAAAGTLIMNGSRSSTTFNNVTTVDPASGNGNNSTFTANNSTFTLNGATMTVNNRIRWDGASAITVGSGSQLNIGLQPDNIFTDGLTIASGGTLGTGNNAATPLSGITIGTVTLESGSTVDYSINGNTDQSDVFNLADLNVTGGAGSVTLRIDMVAGDYKQSDPDLTLFSWTSSGPADFSFIDIQGAEGTNIKTLGTLIYNGDTTSGSIVLSGFEAFAIPEPSTGMLLFTMSGAILLRRYCQAQENRGDSPVIFARL